ncbi:DUF4189 domain-containing protein [Stenotrophomonas maltophilia]|uniref:DUF4189 domain-containing protein n=1 Tax=Stenotrophomonas maltophilia TaxID=40324 RepID=UPI0021C8E268|nr:DUF4189 domain-containing protein [Stenotrophomonas maltophilia]MCU1127950.1 DUF4189 domain-containing protein [Stenotrophomonas maltophilia]
MLVTNECSLERRVSLWAFAFTLLVILCLLGIQSVHAEGRCPPGQYPIGGQGAGGCAPIPGGASGEGASPRPTGRWLKTWGAIATAASGEAGASTGQRTRSAAEKEAVAQCSRGGADNCRVTMAYKNQCVALITPSSVDKGGSVTWRAETEALASKLAMDECTERGSRGCKVFYSACSTPMFEAY